ncbi:MAG: TIGR02206 family membrane protein [Acidobacteria bacterium]|nr:TIGR02206 family membrane protein [Acidobacteriota bacterium]
MRPYNAMTSPWFHPFDLHHIGALATIAALCLLLAWGARRLPSSGRVWLGRLLGLQLALYGVFFYIQQAMAGALSWKYSLPLELCNLVLIACILSLFRSGQWLYEITYFWGLGGTLQALVTPDLAAGFPSWDFFLFFWSHGAILFGIVFIIAVKNFRPRKNSVIRMMIALNAYAIVVGTINAAMDWNYGYLCRKPAVPSLLDLLGPWPWYLLSLEGVALLTFLILARILQKVS